MCNKILMATNSPSGHLRYCSINILVGTKSIFPYGVQLKIHLQLSKWLGFVVFVYIYIMQILLVGNSGQIIQDPGLIKQSISHP